MVILISLLHAIPVIIAATMTTSQTILLVTAGAMIIIAFAFGSPSYAFVDLLAVISAFAIGLKIQTSN